MKNLGENNIFTGMREKNGKLVNKEYDISLSLDP